MTYRNTTQRAVILDAVRGAESHLTAGEIFERVRRRYPTIAYRAVYRSLHLLAPRDSSAPTPRSANGSRR